MLNRKSVLASVLTGVLAVTGAVLVVDASSAGASTTAVTGLPHPDHVVVVVFENHAQNQIIGNAGAPYFNQLAAAGANFTNSFGVQHPSQPNYLHLFSGTNQGINDDSCPHTFSTDNLGAQLLAKGLTFAGYSEDLPATGSTACTSGNYARKHAPWTDFSNVPTSANKPLTSFPTDFTQLPTVSFVIPNLCNDMHDCSVGTGDTWLKNHLDSYVQWAKTHNSLLVTTFDEDNFTSVNQITTLINGQGVKPGNYSETINHYSVLRTLEDMYGLPYAGAASTATPITDIWGTGPAGPVVSGGSYQVKLASGYAMDDPGSSTANSTQLIVWPASTGTNQKWTFTANSDGTYQVKNNASGLCADDAGSSLSAGAKIIQYTCSGANNQHWSLVASGSGYALVNKVSGLAVTAGAAANGSPLTQQANTGTSLQTWNFTKVG